MTTVRSTPSTNDHPRFIERDVSERTAAVWLAYWTRMGWRPVGRPTPLRASPRNGPILAYRLVPLDDAAAPPEPRTAYDRHRA